MSEKKVVRRSVAIALGIICIILTAGLCGAIAYYTMTINNKNTEYYQLKAPKLSLLSVYGEEERLGSPYLHISGEVWNVGSDTAYNCRLHVILYQGSVVAKDTYVDIGTISGENKTRVDAKIYYNGEALTNWAVTPEWTTTP